jgi:hypothetical protein
MRNPVFSRQAQGQTVGRIQAKEFHNRETLGCLSFG